MFREQDPASLASADFARSAAEKTADEEALTRARKQEAEKAKARAKMVATSRHSRLVEFTIFIAVVVVVNMVILAVAKGSLYIPKPMNFQKISERGGGVISDPKNFVVFFFALKTPILVMIFRKKRQKGGRGHF